MELNYKDNPKEILEELLKHHDIKSLRAILNNKVRRKEPKANDYFSVAIDVYLIQYRNESKLEWAIEQIAETRKISDKTIKNHISKFRKQIKDEVLTLDKFKYEILSLDKLEYNKEDINQVINEFINALIDSQYNRFNNENSLKFYKSEFKAYLTKDEPPF